MTNAKKTPALSAEAIEARRERIATQLLAAMIIRSGLCAEDARVGGLVTRSADWADQLAVTLDYRAGR